MTHQTNLTQAQLTAWIAALRSAKYQQGRGFLQVDNKFCCLGVLCDTLPGKWHKEHADIPAVFEYGSAADQVFLTTLVPIDKIPTKTQAYLTELNDHFHWSFAEIANWIEANLLPQPEAQP